MTLFFLSFSFLIACFMAMMRYTEDTAAEPDGLYVWQMPREALIES